MSIHSLRRGSVLIVTSMALLLGSLGGAHAAGVTPASATPVQREQAQSRFLKGRDLYTSGKYEAALIELNASLDIVASPNTRLYIGRCLRELGRTVAAYVELGRTAVEAKELQREDARYEKAAQTATEERSKLTPKLGFVEVTVAHAAPATTLTIAGDEVRRGGWEEPFPVVPGTAEIVVETAGRVPIRKQVQINAGEHKAVAVDAEVEAPLEAAPVGVATNEAGAPGKPPLRTIAYATAGLAVAGLATFVIAGSLANGTYSDLEKACGAGPCPPGHEDDISSGKTEQTIANVGLAIFAIAGAATVTLFVLGSPKKAPPAAASARITAGPSFVGLQGAF